MRARANRPRSFLEVFLATLVFALLAHCNSAHLDVLRTSSIRALPNVPRIAIEPVHTELLRVNGMWESEWIAERTPDQAERWEADKQLFGARFRQAIFERAAGVVIVAPGQTTANDWILRPSVTSIEPRNAFAGTGTTAVDVTIQLVTAAGQIADEVTLFVRVAGNWTHLSITDQMRAAGAQLGADYARYLSARLAGRGPRARRTARAFPPSEPYAMAAAPLPPGYLAPPTDIARIPRPSREARDLQTWGFAILFAGQLSAAVIPIEINILGVYNPVALQIAASSIPVAGPFIVGATLPPGNGEIAAISYATGILSAVGFGLALTGFVLPWERPAPLRGHTPGRAFVVHPLQFAGTAGAGVGISGSF